MRKGMILRSGRLLTILTTFCLLISNHDAQGYDPLQALPILRAVGIHVKVTTVGNIFTYDYTFSNPSTNTGQIFSIDIAITRPAGGVDLSGEGLVNGFPFYQATSNAAIQWFHEKGMPLIPVGLSAPPNWSNSLGGLGAGWGSTNDDDSSVILPGQSLTGFQIMTRGLPAIRDVVIDPDFFLKVDEPVTDEDIARDKDVEEQIKFHGKTLGPTAPPAIFDPLAFITTIRGYIAESKTLGWLTDSTLATTLNGQLDAASAAIPTGDIATAKLALGAFIAALPAPPLARATCTSECSGLLFFNAKYLLDQLPTVPDLVVTGITALANSVIQGGSGSVGVTVTILNQGGGSATSTVTRVLLSADGTVDLTDFVLGDQDITALAVGESKTFTSKMTVSSTIPAGGYTLGACADATGIIAEMSETNNCKAGGVLNVDVSGDTLTVIKSGLGSGAVTSSPVGIDCGATCSAMFAGGTTVTLTAVPDVGSVFVRWNGRCQGTATSTMVTMNANKTCYATFNKDLTLTVAKLGHAEGKRWVYGRGTVTSSPVGIDCGATCSAMFAGGTTVTLTAVPDVGSVFVRWNGRCQGTATSTSVTMNANKTCYATFK